MYVGAQTSSAIRRTLPLEAISDADIGSIKTYLDKVQQSN
jgi:hypothetical protein